MDCKNIHGAIADQYTLNEDTIPTVTALNGVLANDCRSKWRSPHL
ncbi:MULTISPECIES: hypothetical protein [unclassified Leptolyngbya]|nr:MULTISPECIES: hypothetical protein [unclassified Leptolyngbya]